MKEGRNVIIKKRPIFLLGVVFSLVIIAFISFNLFEDRYDSSIFGQFQAFTVTINNQSDNDIVSIETGLIKGTSKDTYTKIIKSGEKTKIKPELSLSGEGAVYIKYTDSKGNTKEKTVCGYTESLSGNSKVTIDNNKVTVEENCM